MASQQDLPLPTPASAGSTIINARCALRAEGDHRVVLVAGFPVHHYSAGDAVAEAYAEVLLVDGGYATQREVAIGFGVSERTVRRHQQRYADGGMAALAVRSGWRPGRRRMPTKRRRIIEQLKARGVSNREIARRLGLTENAIREQVGPSEPRAAQQDLPMASSSPSAEPSTAAPPQAQQDSTAPMEPAATADEAPGAVLPDVPLGEEPEPVQRSLDVDPGNRVWDRLLASFGCLDDAAPLFADEKAVPGAGVLCSLPALCPSGIFRLAHKLYG